MSGIWDGLGMVWFGVSQAVTVSGWTWTSRVGAVGAGWATASCALGASPSGLSGLPVWAGWASSQHGHAELQR